MVNLLPGQQNINGVSNFIFGSNLSQDYATHTVRNTPQMQQQIKAAGVTVMRCAIPAGSADSFLDQTYNACQAMGCAMLAILIHNDLTWNQHLVSYLGNRCNLYEFANEPDLYPISGTAYLALWNQHVPVLRPLNKSAVYIGPVLGVFGNLQSFVTPWLQGCKTSGVLPDAISYHIYPCTSQPSQSVCATKSGNFVSAAQKVTALVTSILGYDLPQCLTEWNIDANAPPQPYAIDPSFCPQWTTAALDSMVQAKLAMACQYDAGSGAAGGAIDLVSTSTYQPQVQYASFAASVKKYLGSGGGGGGGTGGGGGISGTSTLTFSGTAGGSNPAVQTVTIPNSGTSSANYTATTAYSWITVSPSSGTIAGGGTGTSTVGVNLTGLAAGTYNGSVVYTAGTNTVTVQVVLTVSPSSSGATALSVYLAAASSATLSTADQLYITPEASANLAPTTWTYTLVGTATGYGEICAQGSATAWAGAGSIGTPTGKGFFLDPSVLNLTTNQINAGNWSASVRLNCAQGGDTSAQAGSLTSDIIMRAFKYNSGTYTPIVTMTLTGAALTSAFTTFSLPASSASAVTFASGDVLYIDIWGNITANANSSAVQDIRLNRLSTDATGKTGDLNCVVVTPGYQTVTTTALSVFFASAASSTLVTADQLYSISGTPATTRSYTRISTSTGFGEIVPAGTTGTWAAGGSIGSPSGNGFLFDVTTLESNSIPAGNWSAQIRLNCAQNGDTAPNAGNITADIYARAYKRSSGGTYTPIVSMKLASASITLNFTTFSIPSTSGAAMSFSTGDKLYCDVWLNVLTNANASTVQDIRFNKLSTDTTGKTGDPAATILTPGYLSGSGGGGGITASPTSLSFSAPLGGSNPAGQSVTLTNTTGSSASWSASIAYTSGSGWLSLSSSSGTLASSANTSVTVTASISSLAAGTYSASINFVMGSNSVSVPVNVTITQAAFVTRANSTLFEGATAFRGAGANIYWLGLLDINPDGSANVHYPSTTEIDDALATANEMGAEIVRSVTLGASVGNPNSIWTALNTPNAAAFNTIDYAIYRAGLLGIRLIIPLVDNGTPYSGGKSQFTTWRGINDASQFFLNSQVIADFEAYIATILNRTNQYNGLIYKNDPTILAWETGNGLSNPPVAWTTTISAYIKQLDANHLIMDGTVGIQTSALAIANVDIYGNKFYPANSTQIGTDATATSGANKAYVISEWDWTGANGGTAPATFMSAIEGNTNITGDCFYHLMPHDDSYGYVKNSNGYSLYYPGTSIGMQTSSQALRTHGYTMAGVSPVPSAGAVAAPTITSVAANPLGSGMQIEWRGVAGGLNYDLESSTAGSTGPFTLVANLTDSQTPYTHTAGTASTWYRVKAYNYSDVAGPYSDPAFAGGSGGSSAPTIIFTTAGLNLLRDSLRGQGSDVISYVAIGTGNTPPTANDVQLQNEVYRKAVSSFTPGTTGELVVNTYLAASEAVNISIAEVGWFAGSTASSAANSGVLVARGLYSHVKASTESIQIQLDIVL
jgi:mannan endo-1,4-beta-mannosidase